MTANQNDRQDAGVNQCTIHSCDEEPTRRLQWPEPGELTAEFCEEHAKQKLRITDVTEAEKL